MDIKTNDVFQCMDINDKPIDFVVIDTTDTMALCLPVCEKPNKSLAFLASQTGHSPRIVYGY